MATGADDEATLRANRAGFDKFQLRARRLVDVCTVDMRTELCAAMQQCGAPSLKALSPAPVRRA